MIRRHLPTVAIAAAVVVPARWPGPAALDIAAVVAIVALTPTVAVSAPVAVGAALVGALLRPGGLGWADLPLLVCAVVAGLVLRRPGRHDASPSRFAGRLASLVALALAAGAVTHLLEADSNAHANNWVDHAVRTLVGVSIGAVVAVAWRPRADRSAAVGSLLVVLLTSAVVLASVTFWDGRDRDLMTLTSDSVREGVSTAILDDVNALLEKVNVSGSVPSEGFAREFQASVIGNTSVASGHLLGIGRDGSARLFASQSRLGEAYDAVVEEWLANLPRGAISVSDGLIGVPQWVGIAALPSELDDVGAVDTTVALTPHIMLAIVIGQVDANDLRAAMFAIVPGGLTEPGIAPTPAAQGAIDVELLWVAGTEATRLWANSAQRPPWQSVDVPTAVEGRVDVQSIELGEQLAIVAVSTRTPRLGTPQSFRRLALTVEVLGGTLLVALVFVAADQAARRERERLRREALLAAALQGSPGWTAVVDTDDRVVISNNDAHGVPAGARVADSDLWLDEPAVASRISSTLASARGGVAGTFQHHWSRAADGAAAMRIFQIDVRPLPDPRLVYLQCVDITEQRDRAMRTAQSERMEAIGVLAGSLAHDFNNLLFITLGYLQMLERQPVVAGDTQARGFVGRAVEAVERGATVAKSLLSFARSQPLEATAVSMPAFLAALRPLIDQAIGGAHTLEIDVEGDGLDVSVDTGRLSSGLLNIVFNARDAMDAKGTITIRVRRGMATDLASASREMVSIAVSDTGRGMSTDVAARAFEPFFTTKQIGSGTGLGLATVYSFAQQSGGWATIESTEGVGTTVTILLPPAHVDTAPVVANDGTTAWSVRTALVVDDEPALADLVAAWLTDLGLVTRTANTPDEALRIAEEFGPQLVVSDANLRADIDGLELARRLIERLPTLIVVFMTGFSDRIRALQAAGVATLAKPFTRDDLVHVLSEHVGARHTLDGPHAGAGTAVAQ